MTPGANMMFCLSPWLLITAGIGILVVVVPLGFYFIGQTVVSFVNQCRHVFNTRIKN